MNIINPPRNSLQQSVQIGTGELLENGYYLRFGFVYTPGNQIIVQIKESNANLVENYIQLVSKSYSFVISQAKNTQGLFLYKKKTC